MTPGQDLTQVVSADFGVGFVTLTRGKVRSLAE